MTDLNLSELVLSEGETEEWNEEKKKAPKTPYVVYIKPAKVGKSRRWHLYFKEEDDDWEIRKYLREEFGKDFKINNSPYFWHLPGDIRIEGLDQRMLRRVDFKELPFHRRILKWFGGFEDRHPVLSIFSFIIGINVLFFIPKLLGLLFALACFAAPFYYAFMKKERRKKQIFPPLAVILWFGIMLVSVGTIGVPGLYRAVGPVICPPGFHAETVVTTESVKTDTSYQTSTSATAVCLDREENVLPINQLFSGAVLLVVYLILSLAILAIGWMVNAYTSSHPQQWIRFILTPLVFLFLLYVLYLQANWINSVAGRLNKMIYTPETIARIREQMPEGPPFFVGEKNFVVGDKVLVEWEGRWWKAEVTAIKEGEWYVHYDGYGDDWDEWVEEERIGGRD